jgi:hypothetical protein
MIVGLATMFEVVATVDLVDLIYGLTIVEVKREVWLPLNLFWRFFLAES